MVLATYTILHFSTHIILLIKIYLDSTKFIIHMIWWESCDLHGFHS